MILKGARSFRWWGLFVLLLFVGCQDGPDPTGPSQSNFAPQADVVPAPAQQAADQFAVVSSQVLALPQTVFAARNTAGDGFVFGVENSDVIPGVRNVMGELGISGSAYNVRVVEPIQFMDHTLQSEHRPTRGGIQIHFSNYLCTLGFSAGGSNDGLASFERSFFTNSHCTDKQGENSGTVYYQPTSSVNSNPLGVEADDPAYEKGLPGCPINKRCRYSDASRALYESGIDSNGEIAKTTGVNSGSIETEGVFDIASQDGSSTTFSGTLHKVGRTTGWTSGDVAKDGDTDLTCVNVNVRGSNIQLLCQTLVENDGVEIVGSGDSGSPVFRKTGSNSAELAGILWGGNSSGDLFVFSPLKNIQDELGAFDATTDGTGSGTGGGGGGGGDDDGGSGGGNCPPGNPNHKNCS